MSKPKLSRTSSAIDAPDPAQQQLWQEFVKSIRKLEAAHTDSDDLTALYAEKSSAETALEQLNALIKLKRGELSAHPPAALGRANTPTAVGTPGSTGSNLKRKRRQSVSASPAPPSAIEAITAPTARGGTPMNRELNKSKKGLWADQLPLQPGRHVAFRESPAEDSLSDATWILASVIRSIKDDARRYLVRDEDDHEKKFTASLKDLIPLPDTNAPSSSSANPKNLEDFPAGTQVLAVYPGTTSFYRATVIAPPLPGTGNGLGLREPPKKKSNAQTEPGLKGMYKLMFVDDNATIQAVEMNHVVLHPESTRSAI